MSHRRNVGLAPHQKKLARELCAQGVDPEEIARQLSVDVKLIRTAVGDIVVEPLIPKRRGLDAISPERRHLVK